MSNSGGCKVAKKIVKVIRINEGKKVKWRCYVNLKSKWNREQVKVVFTNF